MSRYFVTGATGFVGGALARRLRAAGHEVTAIARRPGSATALIDLGVRVHPGDVTDPATLVEPMRGVDGVFHVAGWYRIGVRDRRPAYAINVEGTKHVLDTMRSLAIPKGVYTSTLAVFGDTHGALVDESYFDPGPWLTEYDRTKWLAHYEVAKPRIAAGLPLVIVQPGLIYGPGDTSSVRRTLQQYLTRRLPALPRGTAYCWSHVDDIAEAHVLAMEKGRAGESYIVAGWPHTLIEAFAIAERITGIPAPRLHPSPATMRVLAAMMGVVERVVPLPENFTREGLLVTAGVTYLGSHEKARRELGYAPRALEPGLRETLDVERRARGLAPPGLAPTAARP